MRIRRDIITLSLLLLLACAAFATRAQAAPAGAVTIYLPRIVVQPRPTAAPTTDPRLATEQQVATLINVERANVGLPALAPCDALALAARGHSLDMAASDYFGHEGSDGSDPGERITAAGYAWMAYGENIAAGYRDPEEVVRAWMGSEGHRAMILSGTFHEIGVGYAFDAGSPYAAYWTVDFASR